MECVKNLDDKIYTVDLRGRFTFSDHNEFKGLFSVFDEEIDTVVLNLSDLEYVDSAALGLFLLFKESAEQKSITVAVTNINGQVEKMFQVSKFQEIFDIK